MVVDKALVLISRWASYLLFGCCDTAKCALGG